MCYNPGMKVSRCFHVQCCQLLPGSCNTTGAFATTIPVSTVQELKGEDATWHDANWYLHPLTKWHDAETETVRSRPWPLWLLVGQCVHTIFIGHDHRPVPYSVVWMHARIAGLQALEMPVACLRVSCTVGTQERRTPGAPKPLLVTSTCWPPRAAPTTPPFPPSPSHNDPLAEPGHKNTLITHTHPCSLSPPVCNAHQRATFRPSLIHASALLSSAPRPSPDTLHHMASRSPLAPRFVPSLYIPAPYPTTGTPPPPPPATLTPPSPRPHAPLKCRLATVLPHKHNHNWAQ